jgi:cellulose synthase/poly-beta-1,6-N-acetylglucosamine synthase-like glycosyltransferase
MAAEIAFWICLAGLAYIFAGYPMLVLLLARWRPRPVAKRDVREPFSIVIVGYNEAERLVRKLDNLLSCEGADRIAEILVASDGSTDRTASLLAAYPDPRVRGFVFAERRGKPACLNELIPQCQCEIIVLNDMRQQLDAGALVQLVDNFADERVGVVSGELRFLSSGAGSTSSEGIGAYWAYEKVIRRSESAFASVPGATGAIYAIRKSLFRPIPNTTLLDDVAIPMQIVAQGYRCVFEADAIAWDEPSRTATQEAIRKRRTIAGAAQLAWLFPQWLLPWRNPIWWQFVSHKLLRLVSPLLLIGMLAAHLMLLDRPIYQWLMAAHLAVYAAGLTGWLCQRLGRRSRPLGVPWMFLSLNFTTLVALYDAIRGRFRTTWRRAA